MTIDASNVTSIKLTYFDAEGRAESLRLALILTGTAFEDDRIQYPAWMALKPTTPHGQLPIMTIGVKDSDTPVVRPQSQALLRWIGVTFKNDKYNLYPSDKMLDVEVALGLVTDLSLSWQPCFYMGMRPEKYGYPEGYHKTEEGKTKMASMRQEWASTELPRFLGLFTDMISKNGENGWLVTSASEGPTIADCLLVPTLRPYTTGMVEHVDVKCLESHPVIVDYVKRFCALDEVKGRYKVGLF